MVNHDNKRQIRAPQTSLLYKLNLQKSKKLKCIKQARILLIVYNQFCASESVWYSSRPQSWKSKSGEDNLALKKIKTGLHKKIQWFWRCFDNLSILSLPSLKSILLWRLYITMKNVKYISTWCWKQLYTSWTAEGRLFFTTDVYSMTSAFTLGKVCV